jgi:hypothetical protein
MGRHPFFSSRTSHWLWAPLAVGLLLPREVSAVRTNRTASLAWELAKVVSVLPGVHKCRPGPPLRRTSVTFPDPHHHSLVCDLPGAIAEAKREREICHKRHRLRCTWSVVR